MTADFINTLGHDFFAWRVIHPTLKTPEGKSYSQKFVGSFAELSPTLKHYNDQGYGIYAVINPGGDKDADITHARAVFVDCDHMAGFPDWSKLPIMPHMVCGRGENSYHLFWLIHDETNLDTWSRLQYKMALWFNADTSVHNPSRIMRVPGFTNTKPDANGVLHAMLWKADNPQRISGVELWNAYQITPTQQADLDKFVMKKAGVQVLTDGMDLEDTPARRLQYLSFMSRVDGANSGGRNTAAYSVVAQGYDYGLPQPVIFEMIREHWNLKNNPPMSDPELWTLTTNAANHKQNAAGSKSIEKLFGLALPPLPATAVSLDSLPPLPGQMAALYALPPLPGQSFTLPPPITQANPEISAAIAAQPGNYVQKMPEVNTATFVRKLDSTNRYLILNDGSVYYYHKDRYIKGSKLQLQQHIDREMAHLQTSQSDCNNVGERVRNFLAIRDEVDPSRLYRVAWSGEGQPTVTEYEQGRIILFSNCYYDRDDCSFKSYDAGLFNTAVATVAYDSTAVCATWLEYLNTAFRKDTDMINQLREFMAACLFRVPLPRTFGVLIGERASGKSLICKVMKSLVGSRAKSLDLNSIEDRHTTASALESDLIIVPEANDVESRLADKVTNFIKATSGRDQMTSRKNYADDRDRVFQGNLLMACNQFPRLSDESLALYSRALVFPFFVSFAGREDFTIEGQIMNEVPGIVNWLLGVKDRVLAPGFSIKRVALGAAYGVRHIRRKISKVAAFCDDCLTVAKDGATLGVGQMREVWNKWCSERGAGAFFDVETFASALASTLPDVLLSDGRGARHFSNVALADAPVKTPAPGGTPVALNLPPLTAWQNDVPISLMSAPAITMLPAGARPLF